MSDIWNEESKMVSIFKKYKDTPFSSLPKSVKEDLFRETEADVAFDNMTEKYTASLIQVIEQAFNIKIHNNSFFSESYEPSAEDIANGVVMVEFGSDK